MATTQSTPTYEPRMARKALVAVAVGNLVEWYDFAVYGYSAVVVAKLFFPNESPTVSLLAALAVFGVAFVGRPLGGIIWGRVGDRYGRRTTLAAVVLLIGASTMAIGLLPTYQSIGVAAPILLVLLRLLQGFSTGGQSSGAATYLTEFAPQDRRGMWAGMSTCTQVLPFVVTALVVLWVSTTFADAYASWAWRIPFLVAGPLALVGLYLRLKLDDTPAFRAVQREGRRERAPLRRVLTTYRKEVLLVMALAGVDSLAFYTMSTYMSTYLETNVGLPARTVLVSNSIGLACYLLIPLLGYLGDRYGRRKVVVAGTVAHVVVAIPGYLVAGQGSLVAAIVGQVLLALPLVTVASVVLVMQSELFPTSVRYTGGAFGFNISYAVFGGTAPFVGQLLVQQFGLLAPAYYLMVVAVLVLVPFVLVLPETSKVAMIRTDNTSLAETAASRG